LTKKILIFVNCPDLESNSNEFIFSMHTNNTVPLLLFIISSFYFK